MRLELLFRLGTWTARSKVSVWYSALWPACWIRVTDRSRTSRFAEVRRIWEVYDEQLRHVPRVCRDYMTAALQAGNVSEAWRIWSLSAEVSLVRTYLLAGVPAPAGGLNVGRGSAVFSEVFLGGRVSHCSRPAPVRSDGGELVHLYKDRSTAGLVRLKRKIQGVCDLLDAIDRHEITLSRSLELGRRWKSVVRGGPVGPVGWADLVLASETRLPEFSVRVRDLHARLGAFLHEMVVHKRDAAIHGWRTSLLLEDPLVHPYRWLRTDRVPPAPFLKCDPGLTPDASGILSDPSHIFQEFREAWLPFFCRGEGVCGPLCLYC